MPNVTNFTNFDLFSNLGQQLIPIGSQVTGVSTSGLQVVIGLLAFVGLVAVLAQRQASMEVMAVILLPSAVLLSFFGWLPAIAGSVALLIAGGIIALALINLFHR